MIERERERERCRSQSMKREKGQGTREECNFHFIINSILDPKSCSQKKTAWDINRLNQSNTIFFVICSKYHHFIDEKKVNDHLIRRNDLIIHTSSSLSTIKRLSEFSGKSQFDRQTLIRHTLYLQGQSI